MISPHQNGETAMRVLQFAFIIILATPARGKDPATVGEAVEAAARRSQITLPGSKPFHLKATIAELDSPDSDYKAEIEMFWVAPDRWRRTVKTPEFSQTMIVNGEKVSEQNQGDYFPWWLNDFLVAMFQLAPQEIRDLNITLTEVGAMRELARQLPPGMSGDLVKAPKLCTRIQQRVGIAPVQNTVFTSVCFQHPQELLLSIQSPQFAAEFSDFRNFGGKSVARKISMTPEPGTRIEARITELTDLKEPDSTLFDVSGAPNPQDRIISVRAGEDLVRQVLRGSPEIQWLPVRDGKTSGTLSLGVSIDRQGHVRETWPLNSDNPYPQDQARKEVAKWTFKPLVLNGVPQQVETVLTFAFETRLDGSIPILSDAEARGLAKTTAEPEFKGAHKPAAGTTFRVRVSVDEQGHVLGLQNIDNLDMDLFLHANLALHKWRFNPYLHDGNPERFNADIIFKVR
jgi:hypothetical protein